ncbi:hypothetical protein COB21_00510 [Candidatus Aerophobetes bacterium]|uniref:Toprim domain-containing protein n=1 Tax=Aerophobetes bacterium TaxID=2030807 RepID=A0A2A4X8W8_UNCAE|nr:MAG: hypothetical protein COB21_00510 [Candidatus Aerophobetes bacterium]
MTQNLEERIKNIARGLGKGKQTQNGRNWLTCCPVAAHNDKNPSFSIGVGDNGRMVYNCFKGCTGQEILGSLVSLNLIKDWRGDSVEINRGAGVSKVVLSEEKAQSMPIVTQGVGVEPNVTMQAEPLIDPSLEIVTPPEAMLQSGYNDVTMAEKEKPSNTKKIAEEIWLKTIPFLGTLGGDYLTNRGLTPELLKSREGLSNILRFDANQQALTAKIQDKNSSIQGIHRIFLKKGGKKIEGQAKKTLGHLKGNMVFLESSRSKLILTEGVEDALTLAICCPDYSVGAFLGGNIDLNPPAHIKEIIVAADNDEAGQKFAKKIKRKLQRQGRAVAIVYPSIGKDFNEWWQAKTDSEGILQAVEQAKLEVSGFLNKKTDAAEIFPYKSLAQEFWIKNLIPKTGVVLLSGHPKTGKSWLTLNFIADILSGTPCLGSFETKKTGIYLLSLEDGVSNLKERFLMVNQNKMPEKGNFYFKNTAEGFDGGGIGAIQKEIEEDPNIKILVIDPYEKVRASSNKSNQNAYSKDYTDMSALTKLADELEICIILVHHFKKQTTGDVSTDQNGSQALSGAVDVLMGLYKDREKEEHTLTVTGRCLLEQTIKLDFDDMTGRYQVNEDLAEEKKSLRNSVVGFFKMSLVKSFTPKEISLSLNYTSESDQAMVRRSIKDLVNDKIIKKVKHGYYQFKDDCNTIVTVKKGGVTIANPHEIRPDLVDCNIDHTPTPQCYNGTNQEESSSNALLPEGYDEMEI